MSKHNSKNASWFSEIAIYSSKPELWSTTSFRPKRPHHPWSRALIQYNPWSIEHSSSLISISIKVPLLYTRWKRHAQKAWRFYNFFSAQYFASKSKRSCCLRGTKVVGHVLNSMWVDFWGRRSTQRWENDSQTCISSFYKYRELKYWGLIRLKLAGNLKYRLLNMS